MASSFEKSVKGATKHKCAAPKAKYVEHILIATHAGEAGIAEVFRALNIRLRETVWTTVFKALIVVHYMIREGEQEVTLKFLKRNPRVISLQHYSDAQVQGRNIRNYSFYLNERARTYGEVRTDFVRSGEGRLRKLTVEKGLLREVECVQVQIRALLKCQFADSDIDNEITLLAFRLLVSDLLVLFHVVNEGVISVLEHYFEMSRYDAERALDIYKVFTKQTVDVVDYLQQARVVEPSTRLQIPNIKHAPTSLTSSLEEYLHDPDFDINRRQYLAAQEAKRAGTKPNTRQNETPTKTFHDASKPSESTPEGFKDKDQPKIAPDLIDFFESIETAQTPMFPDATGSQMPISHAGDSQFVPAFISQPGTQFNVGPSIPTQTGGQFPMQYTATESLQPSFVPITNLMQPIQSSISGAGFNGYISPDRQANVTPLSTTTVSESPQSYGPTDPTLQTYKTPGLQVPQPTGTNPFRQSMVMSSGHSMPSPGNSSLPPVTKSTNPFTRHTGASPQTPGAASPVGTDAAGSFGSSSTPARPMTATGTGTNPFTRSISSQLTGNANLALPTHTGNSITNPFRASVMMQQQQAQYNAQMSGNFSGQTGTMGGLEALDTVPVFPRAQQPDGSSWNV